MMRPPTQREARLRAFEARLRAAAAARPTAVYRLGMVKGGRVVHALYHDGDLKCVPSPYKASKVQWVGPYDEITCKRCLAEGYHQPCC